MEVFGSYLIPILIALILLFGFLRKVPLFDTFLEGAKAVSYTHLDVYNRQPSDSSLQMNCV